MTMDYQKLTKDSLWVFMLSFAAMPLLIIIRIIYARNLSVADYGLFYGCLAFFSIVAFLRELGLRNASQYLTTKYRVFKQKGRIKALYFITHGVQIGVSAAVVAIFMILKPFIIDAIFKNQENAGIIFNFFLIYWILQTIFLSNISFFIGYAEIKAVKLLELLHLIGILIISLILLTITESYQVPVLSYLLATLIFAAFTTFYFWHRHGDVFTEKAMFDSEFLKEVKKYAYTMILATISYFIMTQIDAFMLQTIIGSEPVAFYTTGVSIAIVITSALQPLNIILQPLFTSFWHKKKIKDLTAFINTILHNMLLAVIPISVIFAVMSNEIIILLFGRDYLPSQIILQLFAFIFIIKVYNAFLFMCLPAVGKPECLSRTLLAGVVINIVLDILLIPMAGMIGAAIATAATYLIMFASSLRYLHKRLSLRLPLKKILKTILTSSILIITTFAIAANVHFVGRYDDVLNSAINNGIAVIAGLAAFAAATILLKAIDVKAIISLARRALRK